MTPPPAPSLDLAAAFNAHRHELLGLILRITGDFALAEDALQDTFLAAHAAAAGFRGEARPSTWLYRIATREAMRVRYKAKRHASRARAAADGQNRTPEALPGARVEWLEATQALLTALDQLPEDQRIALVLLSVRAIPVEEIADLLGVPVNTVYTRAFRARVKLKQIMNAVASPQGPAEQPANL